MNVSGTLLDPEDAVDRLIQEYDEACMPIPDIEYEPQVLISKVRKHYMDYLIKLLSQNYETNQKLVNKNIYLPSAIWRCAKTLETKAAQTCMVVQIYRRQIVTAIKDIKKDIQFGRLNRHLYECLHRPPENEKNFQTSLGLADCNCQCGCSLSKKKRYINSSPNQSSRTAKKNTGNVDAQVPLLNDLESVEKNKTNKQMPRVNQPSKIISESSMRMSIESQDSDELMMQLEKLFQGDDNDDDLFDSALCDSTSEAAAINEKTTQDATFDSPGVAVRQESMIENHAAQIRSLDERLASITDLLATTSESNAGQGKVDQGWQRTRKTNTSKWLCEEYYLKTRYFNLLDKIGDGNRKKLARIKDLIVELFGEDSDDEGVVVSPMEETPEFVTSCKERIAPWVVKLLTPYYIKGNIKGKSLFKELAKYLIRLIYQCSRYPTEYEVHSFVSDFLENHKMIRCEADYKQFRIENI